MEKAQITVDGIVLYCDESVEGIDLGNGYTIKKQYFDDLPYKTRLTDGDGKLSINYLGSKLIDNNRICFMCLHKDDVYLICSPQLVPGAVITDKDIFCEDQRDKYNDKELKYLRDRFSLLKLFKEGNIGWKEIIFNYKFNVLGFLNHNTKINDNVTRNIIDSTKYTLSLDEISECNKFLQTYSDKELDILRYCIDEFLWGLDQMDIATSFEQYITTLEMVFLDRNQAGKKQVLSKRIAVLLGNTPDEIANLYERILNFYRFRSESLHEGNDNNITEVEIKELERITRTVLCKYLAFCKQELLHNIDVTWESVKKRKISDLKKEVEIAIQNNLLPE